MTHIPDLWWSPSKGLFHRFPGERFYRPILNERQNNATWRAYLKALPEDAIRLGKEIWDFIRVGEQVSTQDRSQTFILVSGPQAMHLEPVDTDEDQQEQS